MLQAAAISKGLKGEELTDMEALAEAGAAGFTDDGIPLMDEKLIVSAMEKGKTTGGFRWHSMRKIRHSCQSRVYTKER